MEVGRGGPSSCRHALGPLPPLPPRQRRRPRHLLRYPPWGGPATAPACAPACLRARARRWGVSGCPLASMNRILEKGVRAFRNLSSLEVNECALRGDTWRVVHRAIKRHRHLDKVGGCDVGMNSV